MSLELAFLQFLTISTIGTGVLIGTCSRAIPQSPLQCYLAICSEEFETLTQMLNHIKSHHKKVKILSKTIPFVTSQSTAIYTPTLIAGPNTSEEEGTSGSSAPEFSDADTGPGVARQLLLQLATSQVNMFLLYLTLLLQIQVLDQ